MLLGLPKWVPNIIFWKFIRLILALSPSELRFAHIDNKNYLSDVPMILEDDPGSAVACQIS